MKQYTLKPEAFQEAKKKIFFRSFPLMIIALGVGFSFSHFNSPNPESSLDTLSFIIPAGLALMAISLFLALKKQKQLLESYTLILEEDAIIREQKNTPTIRLAHTEIKEIIKDNNGSYIIKKENLHSAIIVPYLIQDPDKLEEALQQIRPLSLAGSSKSLKQRLLSALPLAILALMAVVYLSSNKILVGISGTLFTASMIWSFVQIQRGKNYDKKTKRASYWMAIVLLSVIGITLAKLMA
jgi:hypothetical protein